MSRKLWQRPIVLAVASLALAAGAVSAAQAAPSATAGTSHLAPVADLLGRSSSDCGSGGAGGKGGDGGKEGTDGQPGEPGTHDCSRYSDLPDKSKEDLTVADKVRIVLVLLNGGATNAEVAKKYGMPEDEVEAWKQAYLERDWSALMEEDSSPQP